MANGKTLVSRELLQDIEDKQKGLQGKPPYILKCADDYRDQLRKDANYHSSDIELPGNNNKARRRKSIKTLTEYLEDAWIWGRENFYFPFDISYLRTLASKVEPSLKQDLQGQAEFRTETARTPIENGTHVYPRPEKIPEELYTHLFINPSIAARTPVEQSLYTHFHIARIHPFTDGNGRLARLLQNLILDNGNLPAAIIRSEERSSYLNLLENASRAYRERDSKVIKDISKDERMLFDFIAKKVNLALSEILRNYNNGN